MSTFTEATRKVELEVRDVLVGRPDLSYRAIGFLFDVSESTILKIAQRHRLSRKAGRKHKPQPLVQKAG